MPPRSKKGDSAEWEDRPDGGEARPRPHRAVRLVDAMAERPARPRKTAETPPSETPSRAEVPSKRGTPDKIPVSKPSTRRTLPAESPSAPVPADTFAVLSIHPEGLGETVAVVLSVPAEEAQRFAVGKETVPQETPDGKPARVKIHLLPEQYADLGVKVGTVTAEMADELMEAGKLCGAIRRGMALLGYGDQSARRLVYKLTAKGIDRDTATRAVAYLTQRGYIREDNAATLRAEQDCRKGWGPRRIREDLRAHGFTPEAVEEAMESLSDVDWTENCAAAIRKKYGAVPDDRVERQKLIAAVMRLGYDADTAREALRLLLREG